MSWTKRQFVEQAFEEIGYASYAFDLEPEQLQSAMRRLDSMMATWNGKGIRIGYPIPSTPDNGDLDEVTTVPDYANEAIYLSLAIRLAPSIGKTVPVEVKAAAKFAMNQLLVRTAEVQEMQLPNTLPAGAGNKKFRYDQPFISPPGDALLVGDDGTLDFE